MVKLLPLFVVLFSWLTVEVADGGPADETLMIAALNNHTKLGDLYDVRTHNLTNNHLFAGNLNDSQVVVNQWGSSKVKTSDTKTFRSRSLSFGLSVSAQLTINLLLFKIHINLGSASYLNKFKETTDEESLGFVFSRRTHSKFLTMSQMQLTSEDKTTIKSDMDATHVVSGVTYGSDTILRFSVTETTHDDKQYLHTSGLIGMLVNIFKSLVLKGEGSGTLSPEHKHQMSTVKCSCFSDIDPSCQTEVKTMLDAIAFYAKLGNMSNSVSVPKVLHLTSLANVSPEHGTRKSGELTTFLSQSVSRRLQEYENLQTLRGDTTTTSAYENITALRSVADSFADALKNYQTNTLNDLRTAVAAVKQGTGAESAVEVEMSKLNKNSLTIPNLSEWLTLHAAEAAAVSSVIDYHSNWFLSATQFQQQLISTEYVVVLQLAVFDTTDASGVVACFNTNCNTKGLTYTSWLSNAVTSKSLHNHFTTFASIANMNNFYKGSHAHAIVITETAYNPKTPATIAVMKSGKIVVADFQPYTIIPIYSCPIGKITWDTPKSQAPGLPITGYTVSTKKSDTGGAGEWSAPETLSADTQEFPPLPYGFDFRIDALCEIGVCGQANAQFGKC